MIAANDLPIGPLDDLAPDQLRRLIAIAAGLLADRDSPERATEALRRTARALDHMCGPNPSAYGQKQALPPHMVDKATQLAAAMHRVSPREIHSRGKTKPVAAARQYAMWWLREQRGAGNLSIYSFISIGQAFGRDHTTAHASWKVVCKRQAEQAAA